MRRVGLAKVLAQEVVEEGSCRWFHLFLVRNCLPVLLTLCLAGNLFNFSVYRLKCFKVPLPSTAALLLGSAHSRPDRAQ